MRAADVNQGRHLELEGLTDELIASVVVELETVAETLEQRMTSYMDRGNRPAPVDLERRRTAVLRLRHALMLAWQVST